MEAQECTIQIDQYVQSVAFNATKVVLESHHAGFASAESFAPETVFILNDEVELMVRFMMQLTRGVKQVPVYCAFEIDWSETFILNPVEFSDGNYICPISIPQDKHTIKATTTEAHVQYYDGSGKHILDKTVEVVHVPEVLSIDP